MAKKSYLKYAGSKSRILDQILPHLPQQIETWVEPFVGSCTVALNVEAKGKLLNDLNQDLIDTHEYVRMDSNGILECLVRLYERGREEYYTIREEFNTMEVRNFQDGLEKAARFIYLNKHGFNGLIRYNKKGIFNVPVGKGKSIHFPEEELKTFHETFDEMKGNVGFTSYDFTDVFEHNLDLREPEGMVFYCDPPYVPMSATMSDINYTGEGFPYEKQQELVECAMAAREVGAMVLISNHDNEVTRDLYKDADEIVEIQAFRSISRKGGERGMVKELLAIYRPAE